MAGRATRSTKPAGSVWERVERSLDDSKPKSGFKFDSADIPELEPGGGTDAMGRFVENLDIISAYNKWVAKSTPEPGSKTESIKISCPNPDHPDNDPSAWVNTEKDLWFCGHCQFGGDYYDFAAWKYGYDVPGYRYDGTFRQVVEHMADDFGYVHELGESSPLAGDIELDEGASGDDVTESPETADAELDVPDSNQVVVPPVVIEPSDDDLDFVSESERLPWDEIFDPRGFRYAFMQDCYPNRIMPQEYYAAGGDQLLGLAAGHNISFARSSRVYLNFFQCLVGPTGSGKSSSLAPVHELMGDVLSFDKATGKGVKPIPVAGSGEFLIKEFDFIDETASTPKMVPIVGFMYIDEMSSLLQRTGRRGSVLQPVIVEMFSSVDRSVSTASLTGGRWEAYRPYLGFTTSIQPKLMNSVLGENEINSGFLNRFAYYTASAPEVPAAYDPSRGDPPYNLDESARRLTEIRDWVRTDVRSLTFDGPAAREAFNEIFFEERWEKRDFDHAPMLARIELLFYKLILACAVDVCADSISVDHVMRARAYLNYFKRTSLSASRFVDRSEYDECAEKIITVIEKKISKHPDGVPIREVRRGVRSTKFVDQFDKVFKFLVDSGVVEATQKKGVGRPTVLCKVVKKKS